MGKEFVKNAQRESFWKEKIFNSNVSIMDHVQTARQQNQVGGQPK